MNNEQFKKVQEFIKNENFETEISDLNEIFDYDNFEASNVQINVLGKSGALCYQTSNTCDCGAISSDLDLSNEDSNNLTEMLLKNGFDDNFIEDNLEEITNIIKKELSIQKKYDKYMNKLGNWERAPNCLDSNSEVFVKHEK